MSKTRASSSVFTSVMHVCGSAAFALSLLIGAATLQQPSASRAAIPASAVRSGVSVVYIPAVTQRQQRRQTALKLWNAVHQKAAMLKQSLSATFVAPDGTPAGTWTVSLAEHPSWIVYETQGNAKPVAVLSADAIAKSIVAESLVALPAPVNCDVNGMSTDKQNVIRIETSCIAKSGYVYDVRQMASALKQAFDLSMPDVALSVTPVAGKLTDAAGAGVGNVVLMATGRSNFKGSGEGRKNNVRKAIGQQVNNVVVPTDADFSFNDVLGGPVTTSAGWSMALTIFEGVNLRPAPGGGICQASTTVYRAALKAGLPIVEQKSHSLYVSYYEAYGVGQDATVFPGQQNLRFHNNTGAPLVLQSYYEGDDAYVNILGRPDGRTVTIDGPYFGQTAPADLVVNGRALRNSEIAWIRTVTNNDGSQQKEVLVSRYNAVPKSLVAKWPATSQQIVHAAAPDLVADER
ncbi:MAG TPA: VanW family protein [Candidatus Peribacteria bacterium]|nr:VanW family protein [Candidatus Peribacteria bacterium]